MNANVAEALRRLRAADPAAEAGDQQWDGSPAEEIAQRRLHQQDVVSIDEAQVASPRHSSRRWAAAAAAAVVAAAVGIGVATLTSSQPGSAPTRHSPLLGDTPPRSALSNRVKAEALVVRLLAHAPVLPHAVRHSSSPGGIRFAGETPGSRHLITRTAWWTAPGTVDEAITYLGAHKPARDTTTGSFDSGGTGRDFHGVDFAAPGTDYATSPSLQISVTRYHGGVAVQAQVHAIWVPRRPDWTRVIAPRAVVVTVQRGTGHPAVHRTLRGSGLHRLADVVNALAVQPYSYPAPSCPQAYPGTDQLLRFTTSDGTITVRIATTGCAAVSVSAPGHRPFELQFGSLSRTVLNLLGLKPIRR